MLFYALFCASIIALAVTFSVIFERRFEETAALAVFADILVLYAAGYLGKLSVGVVALLIICGVAFLISVCVALGRQRFKTLAVNTFTLGFFVFLALMVVIYLSTKDMTLAGAETNPTLININLIAENENFEKVAVSSVAKLGYQPGYALFCWMFTSLDKTFVEVNIIRAANIFVVAMILPLLSRIQWKSILVGLFTAAATVFLPWVVISNMQIVNTVNVDAAVALIFGFMLFAYFCHEQCGYTYWAMGLASAVLCIMRPGAELIAAFMMLLVIVDIASCGFRDFAEMLAKPARWLSVVFYVILSMGGFISWWKFAGEHGIMRMFECIFLTEERREGFAKIFTTVFEFFKTRGTVGEVNITYFGWLFILAILGGGAAALGLNMWDRIRTGVKAFIIILGSVGFTFLISFIYTYTFPADTDVTETLTTYLTGYLIASLFAMICLLIGKIIDRFYTFGRLLVILAVVIVFITAPMKTAYDSTIGKALCIQESSSTCHIDDTEQTQFKNNI